MVIGIIKMIKYWRGFTRMANVMDSPMVLNMTNIHHGHFTSYTIQKGDSIRYLMKMYGANVFTSTKLFIDVLNVLNNCDLRKEMFKVGQQIKVPTIFVDINGNTRLFSYHKRLILLDDKETECMRRSYCSICNGNDSELHELALGSNNHTQSITLCEYCLSLLYRRIGEVLNIDK